MKKFLLLVLLINCSLLMNTAIAQAPNAIPYQGVARNAAGNILSAQPVSLRISIHDGTAVGTVVYSETHNPTTSNLGLFNINIGQGTPLTGTLGGVNWGSGAKFIQVEMDATGGSTYTNMGTTQLNSVPYALYAASSGGSLPPGTANGNTMRWNGTAWVPDNTIYNNGNNVGIGTNTPAAKLDVAGNIKIADGTEGAGKVLTSDANGLASWQSTAGLVGPQGPAGNDGATGAQGPIGLTGLTGATGAQGPAGNDGATGAQGPIGLTGLTGATGAQGPAGNDGATGAQGPIGLTGAQGPAGNDGATGAQGPIGLTGATGATGAQGPPGNDGATGAQGPIGLTGAQGPAGNDGATGAQGPIGLTGAQGPAGNDGATGAQGPAGNDGATGAQGPIGLTGATGATGAQGPAGLLTSGAAAGNTPFWDGTTWITNSSNIFNNGTNVGIGTATPTTKLSVTGDANTTGSMAAGTTVANASAILEASSTTKGFLMPRMTTTQRDAIASPAIGLQIFNLDDQCTDLYDGSNWIKTCGLKVTGTATDPGHPTPNSWTQKANFGGMARYSAVGFSIGSKGYIGTGYATDYSYKNDFWEYDPNTNAWTQKANFGGTARSSAVGFSIGSKGYIGTGIDGSYKNDFWEYDPASNAWVQKANFGGAARFSALGFSIGSKGYIGTGYATDYSYKNDFWEYDPASDAWTQKANFGGTARYWAVGFSIGSKGYIGTGYESNNFKNDFWEYDPNTNAWTQKANFGGTARSNAVGFSIGSKGYIGTGVDGSSYKNDFWEYDPNTNAWTQKANFGGTARYWPVGFSIGSKGYIGTGEDGFRKNDFWEYMDNNVTGNAYSSTGVSSTTGNSISDGAWTLANNTVYNANTGNVGIGTTNPTAKLDITGNLRASTTITASGLSTAGIVTNTAAGLLGTIPTIPVANGGTGTSTALTSGSIPFAGAGGVYSQNNANLFWDNTNARLGIGITTPAARFHLQNDLNAEGGAIISNINAGSTASSIIRLRNNSSDGVLFKNSSTRTVDGGPNTLTLRNDNADLRLQGGGGGTGILVQNVTGNVGIGTTSPTYKFQVGDGATVSSALGFIKGYFGSNTYTTHGRIMFNDKNFGIGAGSFNGIAGDDDLYLWSWGGGSGRDIRFMSTTNGDTDPNTWNTNMTIQGNTGNVGIGIPNPSVPLHINRASSIGSLGTGYLYNSNGLGGTYSGGNLTSILATGTIIGANFFAVSDARVKNTIAVSNTAKDLQLLNRLKVTDYTYIDKLLNGTNVSKKVIAQEVEKVLPNAVNKQTNFIPDIYTLATKTSMVNGKLNIIIDKPHGLKVGDKLKWTDENDQEQQSDVTAINSATSFEINYTTNSTKAFVYGKQVNDFRTVDYEAIAMLNVSATQELSKQLDVAKIKIDELEKLKADYEARLKALEEKLNKLLGITSGNQ